MKNPKRLTRAQKKLLAGEIGQDEVREWLVLRELPNSVIFIQRETNETMVVEKGG